MNLFGILIVVLGIALMLYAIRKLLGEKERMTRERDVDEPAERGTYFGLGSTAGTRLGDHQTANAPTNEKTSADEFRFSPELFEHRSAVIEKLESEGFSWLTHYSSVDCLHDQYGLEVCGIHERNDATAILKLLTRMFPDWKPG